MAEKSTRPFTFALKLVRLSFPTIWEKKASAAEGKPKFSATALMDPNTKQGKENLKLIEEQLDLLGKQTWKEKWDKVKRKIIEDKRYPLTEGESNTNAEGDVYDGYEGMMAFRTAQPKSLKILDRDKTELTADDGTIYGGCYVDMVVQIYAITDQKKGGNGIFASLEIIRFRRDGEAFGAAPVNEDDYLDDVDDEDDDDDLV